METNKIDTNGKPAVSISFWRETDARCAAALVRETLKLLDMSGAVEIAVRRDVLENNFIAEVYK